MKIQDIMEDENDLADVVQKIKNRWPLRIPKVMYHVTKKENLASIKEHGLLSSKYGDVHGSMNVTPPKPAVYLSIHKESNNLNSALRGHELVALKIDTSYLDTKRILVDDGFYHAFGDESVFYEVEDTAYDLDIDDEDAEILLDYMENLKDHEIMTKTRFLLGWYISEHGEVCYMGDIPPEAIVSFRDIENIFQ